MLDLPAHRSYRHASTDRYLPTPRPSIKGLNALRPGGYNPAFFNVLAEVDDQHFWMRSRNDVIQLQMSLLTARMPPGYRFLEIGCGQGNVLRALEKTCAAGSVMGMDLFREGLAHA